MLKLTLLRKERQPNVCKIQFYVIHESSS